MLRMSTPSRIFTFHVIVAHKKYDLFGKMLFERATIIPPFKKVNMLSNEACFLHIIEGEYTAVSETSLLKVVPKESVLLKCGHYLSLMPGSPHSKKYETLAVHFHPDTLRSIYHNDIPGFLKNPNAGKPGVGMAKVAHDVLFQKYVESLVFYFENPALVNEDLLILKLKELILLLSQTKDAPLVHQILADLFSPDTYSFKEVVDAHIFSNITVTELAQLTNLSVSSFKRKFQKIYLESPAAYLKTKKLEKAAELLQITDRPINDIALDCGFNSLAHFSKSFQEKYNNAPTKYRLSQKYKSLD